MENFWRYLELFSKNFRKIFRPNLGIYLFEPNQRSGSFPADCRNHGVQQICCCSMLSFVGGLRGVSI